MNKKNMIALALPLTVLVTAVGMGLLFNEPPAEERPSEASSQEELVKTAVADRTRYIMREYGGHIAVFNEDGSLHSVYDEVNVDLLPEYDRRLLKNGIQITGEKELRERVEDYIS